jgi:hypothetical protein
MLARPPRPRPKEELRPAVRGSTVRPPSPIGIAAPALGKAGHRNSNPAMIGGSSPLGKRSTGVIDGKQVARRP